MGQVEAGGACHLFEDDYDTSPPSSRRRSTSSDCFTCFDKPPIRDRMEKQAQSRPFSQCDFEPLVAEGDYKQWTARDQRPPWLQGSLMAEEVDKIKASGYSQRDVMEFEKGSPPPSARMPSMWRRRLSAGVDVSLDHEPVNVKLDEELACLEVEQHDILVPLSVLNRCEAVACNTNEQLCDASHYELRVVFECEELDALVFQFDEESDRTGFKEALEEIAAEARAAESTLQLPMDTDDACAGDDGVEEAADDTVDVS